MQEEEKRERIKVWMAICLAVVALFVDGIQVLLTPLVVVGPVITVAAYFGFWLWFKLLKVSFISNPKKLAWFALPGLIDVFLNVLPGTTASVVATTIITMAEDKGGIIGKVAEAAQGRIK